MMLNRSAAIVAILIGAGALASAAGPQEPSAPTLAGQASRWAAPANELSQNLAIFSNLVATQWEGTFEDSKEPAKLHMSWELILGGTSVQMNGSSTGMTRRNTYYWDPERKHVAYLGLTSNGYVATGTVHLAGSRMTFLGRQARPDGTVTDTREEWEFQGEGAVRVTGYRMQDGQWHPGHRILYTRTGSR